MQVFVNLDIGELIIHKNQSSPKQFTTFFVVLMMKRYFSLFDNLPIFFPSETFCQRRKKIPGVITGTIPAKMKMTIRKHFAVRFTKILDVNVL